MPSSESINIPSNLLYAKNWDKLGCVNHLTNCNVVIKLLKIDCQWSCFKSVNRGSGSRECGGHQETPSAQGESEIGNSLYT